MKSISITYIKGYSFLLHWPDKAARKRKIVSVWNERIRRARRHEFRLEFQTDLHLVFCDGRRQFGRIESENKTWNVSFYLYQSVLDTLLENSTLFVENLQRNNI